jgi:hypothetical protein
LQINNETNAIPGRREKASVSQLTAVKQEWPPTLLSVLPSVNRQRREKEKALTLIETING